MQLVFVTYKVSFKPRFGPKAGQAVIANVGFVGASALEVALGQSAEDRSKAAVLWRFMQGLPFFNKDDDSFWIERQLAVEPGADARAKLEAGLTEWAKENPIESEPYDFEWFVCDPES